MTKAPELDSRMVLHPNFLLFCDLDLFKQFQEQFLFFLHTSYIRQSDSEEEKEKGVFLVISTHGLYLLNLRPKKPGAAHPASMKRMALSEPSRHLKLTGEPLLFFNLLRIDVGLGYQYLAFHFQNQSSLSLRDGPETYVFLFRDSQITSEILNRLPDLLKRMPAPKKMSLTQASLRKQSSKHLEETKAQAPEEHEGFDNPFFKTFDEGESRSGGTMLGSLSEGELVNVNFKEAVESLRSLLTEEDAVIDQFLCDYSLVQMSSSLNPQIRLDCAVFLTKNNLYVAQGFPF